MADTTVVAGAGAVAGGGSHLVLIIGIIVILIIVIAGAAYIFIIAPGSGNGLRGSGSVSQQVLAILPPNQTKSFSGVMAGIAQNIAANPQFAIDYSGSAVVGVSLLSFTIPLSASYQRYAPSSRLTINGSGSVAGHSINFSSVYVRVNSTSTYSCVRFSGLNSSTGSSAPQGYQCTHLAGVSNIFQALQSQNTSSVGSITGGQSLSSTFNISMRNQGTRYYNGQPCLFVVGSGSSTVSAQPGSTNSTYQISMCLSGNYSVPLNFSLTGTASSGTSTTHFAVNLNEVFIGTPLSQSQVSALPGPVANSIG